MKNIDGIALTGELEITLYDETMGIKDSRHLHNIVVDSGKIIVASLLLGDGAFAPLNRMKIGSGSDVATVAQEGLSSVLGDVALTKVGTLNGSRADNVITYEATFEPGVGTGEVKEAGMFYRKGTGANAKDTMFNRTVFGVVNKASGDTLTIRWSITIN